MLPSSNVLNICLTILIINPKYSSACTCLNHPHLVDDAEVTMDSDSSVSSGSKKKCVAAIYVPAFVSHVSESVKQKHILEIGPFWLNSAGCFRIHHKEKVTYEWVGSGNFYHTGYCQFVWCC